ncbi:MULTISPECIES: N-acetylneuraminate synthase family protein [unclassified Bradyrhizobium]|uniref:N-acetylneuraminate synthase family protein n=1 Tax=unclassified Bradyrhizobium TaxID=2631580 RepID=UPI001FF899F7|nr:MULTISPECIES: N-acetylneuraminate synthase family protein [unclassified Bradyrhizobium]MCK1483027.1 N-acetylneuraminate synthase family protein [Bradyrhizobium sp. 193]MCK1504391.1 N-acetylneuraminate synthase family protein [Bradyrhizobium sp. 18]MCK1582963.1 N-acetylneuraminate synthase family protein [Bradyrhizobium sp. 168]UPK13871.1 N-acetylneuraminate synthase family protein [Bradyrhizobium sp. 155]UPK17214.1 N-acetylneuraminate synthase family protein [Bradyrhizobium sp. 131]
MLMTSPNQPAPVRIGNRLLGDGEPCYVIAEIGNNHNGDFDRAIALVDAAVAAGADCAKFQMRKLDEVYRASSLSGKDDDLAVEYTLDLLRRFELPPAQQKKIAEYCAAKGIQYLCTPWDAKSVAVLEEFGVLAYKVASADLTNLPLLACLAATGKTLIVSTGMSTTDEIKTAAKFLDDRDASYVLLHCQSTYPAALHNIHLRFMETLREIHPLVGYSGHERGVAVSTAAVALGAIVIERHITLDRGMEGPDHAASLEPEEFKTLVSGIREVEAARGEKLAERALSQGELINRENLAKSLVAARDLPAGTVISDRDIAVKSPGQGLSPLKMPALLGRKLTRTMAGDDYFFQSDLDEGTAKARRYRFDRPWGVPVRYHDTERFLEICEPDIIEFHLSYSDMERDPATYLSGTYDLGFVVHAPELFAGSKLMDLATPDEALRRYSLEQTQAVIDITRGLKKFFPKTKRPPIVANIGGFTMDEPLPPADKAERYRIFAQSLKELDMDGVELTPQTMAPFPWHFGGQRHQNIFIFPEESAAFCAKHDLRMCVDISHTKLAANHFGFDFAQGLAQLGPHTAHLHFGDAKGLDGEGLQVGEGEIDFDEIGRVLRKHAPTASFIPEIWQGHKNMGEGFWIALERLEGHI